MKREVSVTKRRGFRPAGLWIIASALVIGTVRADEANPAAAPTGSSSGTGETAESGQAPVSGSGKAKQSGWEGIVQQTEPEKKQKKSPTGDVQMQEVTVSGEAEWTSPDLTSGEPNAPILPTTAPVVSTFGTPINVMDAPRQITPVNQTLLRTSGALYQGYMDPLSISSILPTAYTELNWGMGNSVTIRGRQALPYINGIEMTLQNDAMQGVPFSWNMVENMDIQEGPANAVFGATQASTGSVNYITKQPYFDKFRGRVWDTTGMYQQYLWGADIGGPVDKEGKLAWRFSYMGQEQGSYYQYMYNDQQNFYFTVGWKPTDNYSANFYGDYGMYDFYPELADLMNRPTNQLIQNGLYLPGTVPGFPFTVAQGGPATGSAINPPFNTYAQSPVGINRRATIWSPYGGGNANNGFAQLVQTVQVNDDLQIVNNSFLWYTKTEWLEPQLYAMQYTPGDYEFDNRTEVRWTFDPLASEPEKPKTKEEQGLENVFGKLLLKSSVDTGVEWHYEYHDDYFSESAWAYGNSWSLVDPLNPAFANPALFYLPGTKQFNSFINNPKAAFGGLWHVPGAPANYFYEPLNGASGSTFGHYWSVAPFWQHNLQITDKFALYFGVRATAYFWDFTTPEGPAGMPQIPGVTTASLQQASLAPLINISPTYKPFDWMTAYFNYNWSYVNNVAVIGGAAPTFDAASFRLLNQLIEGGLKFNLLNDKLFITAAGFTQDQQLNNLGLPPTPATITGYEVNLAYQPDKHWWVRAGYIDMHGVENWTALTHGPSMRQDYSTAFALQQALALNTNLGLPPGIYNMIGFPEQYASATITYTSDIGLGGTIQGIVMSDQYLDYLGSAKIPTQYILNAQIFYVQPKWEARLYLYNFTNNNYWLPFGLGSAGSRAFNESSIVAGWPFWIEGNVVFKF
ncbi:Outer membrane receptor protein, mostly Fe transport [Methylacidimicrobium sp. AP8]|uniref:TonB-dependent receptor n=1 Tax=Methylacidimicrobium sp. AP8 TaxID=2730359 RepID=UPI0018C079C9|nr:TonB-dependent receptor [Methylacidimicrobium sp. AP8]CAB4242967.1 Outer membrane receptor protein, mostly Fe transport [Methylacidimicrobium sp. AP8]